MAYEGWWNEGTETVIRTLLVTAVLAGTIVSAANGRESPAVYRCGNVQGVALSAPSWQPKAEAVGNATVLLSYGGNGLKGSVQWSGSRHAYEGLGFAMKGGFVIIVTADEFTETYTVNEADREVLVTMARSGSTPFPNSSKAFRGSCAPTVYPPQ